MKKIISLPTLGVAFSILAWGFVFISTLAIIGDPHPAHMEEALKSKALYFRLFQFSAFGLVAASLVIGVKYFKKAKVRSTLSLLFSALLIGLEVYIRAF